jgi:hypothetical protein
MGRATRRATRRSLAVLVSLTVLAVATAAWAQSSADSPGFVEPPPEGTEGADYEYEPADSLEAGALELGYGASGRSGSRPRQTRRVRFRDGGVGGSVREGEGDPLAGGTLEADAPAGRVGAGRLAPRWGRGLVLGAAGEPWSVAASDRGESAPFRGRAGRGAWYHAGERSGVDLLCGRFARRDLVGGRLRVGGAGLGVLGDRAGERQWSLGLARGSAGHELALDRSGRWRAELALARSLGPRALAARVRGGASGFRSIAEPGRSGPARALALELREARAWGRIRAQGALWRFGPGRGGARAALEVSRRLAGPGALALGFEERHGTHRESGRVPGFRQGAWGEWRGGVPGLGLALRHEVLGAERLARAAVRTVTAVRLELEGPAGSALRVTHCAFRVRSGESLYLVEDAGDRIVLRTVSGTGRRTRLELRVPGAGGRVHGTLELQGPAGAGGAAARPRWTLDWTRRARARP